jgi:hypothetical protein
MAHGGDMKQGSIRWKVKGLYLQHSLRETPRVMPENMFLSGVFSCEEGRPFRDGLSKDPNMTRLFDYQFSGLTNKRQRLIPLKRKISAYRVTLTYPHCMR